MGDLHRVDGRAARVNESSPDTGRPWGRATLWLAFLAPFFFASYGLANWLAARRDQVGTIVFPWEHHIPFWPWTIVPYWSIDLLYGTSLFFCLDRRELDTHARRLLAAQIFAVGAFVIFPLRFSFVRPEAEGVYGWMFGVLAGFDRPFNQAPSLHIALLVILWCLYARRLPRHWAWALHAWFVLILLSVLTTYQHHFIDVPTGLWLGWLCVWLFPQDQSTALAAWSITRQAGRIRIALGYAAGAVTLTALALILRSWALWLLWPAASLALVAAIYAFLDAPAFQKGADGSWSLAASWLLLPYQFGARCNARLWAGRSPARSHIAGNLYVGRLPGTKERNGLASVVDLTAELPFRTDGTRYRCEPMLDLAVPSIAQLEASVRLIEAEEPHGTTLVCCALGLSRSATAAAAWLIRSGLEPSVEAALARIRQARGSVVVSPAHRARLERFHRGSGRP